MAKSKIIVFGIFLSLVCTGLSGQNARDRITHIYTGEIGVRELTGNNDGESVEKYLASVGMGKGNAWCAAFVTWVFLEADVSAQVSAWSPSWFPASKTVYVRGKEVNLTPNRTDVFGIWFNNLKRIAHVGFIDEWKSESSYCITVEGNTNDAGSREGDGVYRKRRLKNQIYKVSRWVD